METEQLSPKLGLSWDSEVLPAIRKTGEYVNDDEDNKIEMLPNSQNGNTVGKTYIINESGVYTLMKMTP